MTYLFFLCLGFFYFLDTYFLHKYSKATKNLIIFSSLISTSIFIITGFSYFYNYPHNKYFIIMAFLISVMSYIKFHISRIK